jgi:hypothetical protein
MFLDKFLTSALFIETYSASRSGHFNPKDPSPVPLEMETPEQVWAARKEPQFVGPRAPSLVAVTD